LARSARRSAGDAFLVSAKDDVFPTEVVRAFVSRSTSSRYPRILRKGSGRATYVVESFTTPSFFRFSGGDNLRLASSNDASDAASAAADASAAASTAPRSI
jgi:hypothetical protein